MAGWDLCLSCLEIWKKQEKIGLVYPAILPWLHCHHWPRPIKVKCICELLSGLNWPLPTVEEGIVREAKLVRCRFCPDCGRKLE